MKKHAGYAAAKIDRVHDNTKSERSFFFLVALNMGDNPVHKASQIVGNQRGKAGLLAETRDIRQIFTRQESCLLRME
ncbi:hypothetical protein ACIQW9_07425 [Herminiimonas sp. NPDC097707]|uniref:hypothetical protein n=1 Tax=Herminiimonas sp. NPDC097707 TaxID=3364007 RepID=UPI00383B3FA6